MLCCNILESNLRDNLSVSILKLQENGILDKLKHKWWKENAVVCPKVSLHGFCGICCIGGSGQYFFV